MFAFRVLAIALSTIVHASISFFYSLSDPNGFKQNRMAQRWARSLLAISGVKVTVVGREHIVANASYVFASNHLSYLDTPVVLANLPVQFRFLAKRGLFKIPFLGGHLKRGGHIPVPREDPRAAIRTLTEAGQIIRQTGTSLLVFPEGGRSRDGGMRVFKEGAAYLGIKAGVPIVPIALIGTREVLPFGSGHIRPGRVTLRVGEPIETGSLVTRDRAALTERIRQQIVALSEQGKA